MPTMPVSVDIPSEALLRATTACGPSVAAAHRAMVEEEFAQRASLLPRRLLVVEADPALARTLARILLRDGLRIDLAGSFLHALAHLRERSYHVVLINMQLKDQA